jgi:VanZ family protein
MAVLFGIAVEIGQHFLTTTRQADVWDVVANTIGSIAGILVSIPLFESRKK